MKFYRCSKKILKWKEMAQTNFKWDLPILIDTDLNVILGNSLKDILPDSIIVVQMDNIKREMLFSDLYEIEEKIVLENSEDRLRKIYGKVRKYLMLARAPEVEQLQLFTLKDTRCITPELYIEPPPYDFNKHKSKADVMINGGYLLLEEFYEKDDNTEEESDIEVDLEILKELL